MLGFALGGGRRSQGERCGMLGDLLSINAKAVERFQVFSVGQALTPVIGEVCMDLGTHSLGADL